MNEYRKFEMWANQAKNDPRKMWLVHKTTIHSALTQFAQCSMRSEFYMDVKNFESFSESKGK